MKKQLRKPKHSNVNKKPAKLGAHLVTMGQRWKLVPIADFIGDSNLQGQCDKDRREIRFKSGVAEDAMLDTILHEVLHAYHEINRFPETLPEDPHAIEEYFCQWTSAVMVDFIRNNPAFIMLLISTWKGK